MQRVAEKFNNNGSGVRGDLATVIRTILLDDEAMTPQSHSAAGYDYNKFGKLKEPILRLSGLLRAFGSATKSGRYGIDNLQSVEYGINQGPLQSPSVFNFFHPEFVPPGPVGQANAVGPEFEITTTTSIAATGNYFGGLVWGSDPSIELTQAGFMYADECALWDNPPARDGCLYSDLSPLYAIWQNSAALLDYLNLIFAQGGLPSEARTAYAAALDASFPVAALPSNPTANDIQQWQGLRQLRVKGAMWLVVHSPEFQIQR